MRFLGIGSLLLVLALAGCAGGRIPIGSLADDFTRFEREVESLAPSAQTLDILEAGRVKQSKARALEQERKTGAYPLAMMALADSRTALSLARMEAAQRRADGCLRHVEQARRKWQEAFHHLEQTESVVARTAALPRKLPEWTGLEYGPLPTSTHVGIEPPELPPADLAEVWKSWSETANERTIPHADLESLYRDHVERALSGEVKEAGRQRHLHIAGRVIQELEARVREESANEVCARATDLAVRLADGRDDALRATLDLERGLQEHLRGELEKNREDARGRQDDLYDALQQLEGDYARITQEARGTIVSLADILFDFDRATLKRDVEFSLVRIATILNQFPEMHITIEGHTDDVGTQEYNLNLSRRRAEAVFQFLETQGVRAARMSSEGFGMVRPVANNASEEGRQKNRRVDLVIQEG